MGGGLVKRWHDDKSDDVIYEQPLISLWFGKIDAIFQTFFLAESEMCLGQTRVGRAARLRGIKF